MSIHIELRSAIVSWSVTVGTPSFHMEMLNGRLLELEEHASVGEIMLLGKRLECKWCGIDVMKLACEIYFYLYLLNKTKHNREMKMKKSQTKENQISSNRKSCTDVHSI